MAGLFDEAIAEGVFSGVTIAFYKGYGVIPADCLSILRHPNKKPRTPRERGCRSALLELGLLRRRLWWLETTAAGQQTLAMRETTTRVERTP